MIHIALDGMFHTIWEFAQSADAVQLAAKSTDQANSGYAICRLRNSDYTICRSDGYSAKGCSDLAYFRSDYTTCRLHNHHCLIWRYIHRIPGSANHVVRSEQK